LNPICWHCSPWDIRTISIANNFKLSKFVTGNCISIDIFMYCKIKQMNKYLLLTGIRAIKNMDWRNKKKVPVVWNWNSRNQNEYISLLGLSTLKGSETMTPQNSKQQRWHPYLICKYHLPLKGNRYPVRLANF
jgi:hypothetical protein